MSRYYDVAFHELNGKTIIKKSIISKKKPFDVWHDACVSYTEDILCIMVNEDTFITLNRKYVTRIDVKRVINPVDKKIKTQDEVIGIVNSLSNMGF